MLDYFQNIVVKSLKMTLEKFPDDKMRPSGQNKHGSVTGQDREKGDGADLPVGFRRENTVSGP